MPPQTISLDLSSNYSARPPNYCTKPCMFFEQGRCNRGDQCTFIHEINTEYSHRESVQLSYPGPSRSNPPPVANSGGPRYLSAECWMAGKGEDHLPGNDEEEYARASASTRWPSDCESSGSEARSSEARLFFSAAPRPPPPPMSPASATMEAGSHRGLGDLESHAAIMPAPAVLWRRRPGPPPALTPHEAEWTPATAAADSRSIVGAGTLTTSPQGVFRPPPPTCGDATRQSPRRAVVVQPPPLPCSLSGGGAAGSSGPLPSSGSPTESATEANGPAPLPDCRWKFAEMANEAAGGGSSSHNSGTVVGHSINLKELFGSDESVAPQGGGASGLNLNDSSWREHQAKEQDFFKREEDLRWRSGDAAFRSAASFVSNDGSLSNSTSNADMKDLQQNGALYKDPFWRNEDAHSTQQMSRVAQGQSYALDGSNADSFSNGAQEQSAPMRWERIESNDVGGDLESRLRALVKGMLPPPEESIALSRCLADLKRLLHQEFEDQSWRVSPVGNAVNGFTIKGYDFDVVAYKDGPLDPGEDSRSILQRYDRRLRNSSCFWVTNSSMLYSRVPTLKLRYVRQYDVELSINSTSSLSLTRLLRAYAFLHPRVSELGVAVKLWAKDCEMLGGPETLGSLPSDAILLMVIYYLQVGNAQLPSLQQGWRDTTWDSDDAANYVAQASKATGWRLNFKLSSLFRGFFTFYAEEFQWGSEVVSVRTGCREVAGSTCYSKLRHREEDRLHIEDPFDQERNLVGIISPRCERMFRSSFFASDVALKEGYHGKVVPASPEFAGTRHSAATATAPVQSGHPDSKVYVGGLAATTTWQSLRDHMGQVGTVTFAKIFKDRGGTSLPACVEYSKVSEAKIALTTLNGTFLDGRRIFVDKWTVKQS